MIKSLVHFFLENKLVAYLMVIIFVFWGLMNAPFDFGLDSLPRNPVAVDAIPDIGENQQIVFTKWEGRSPQDVEDQITYPLTTSLLGIPGVKSIRSNSMFGFSSIYIIFDEDIEFYWSRSRILEKLNALPANILPEGVQPTLGPDATALGQIFWYTLEGRNKDGEVTGGWDLHELRSIQDYIVRYGLSSAEGVSEVASIGGYVKEYQVDVDPEAMKIYKVTLDQVMKAVRENNVDVGAQTIEINLAEYFVRGLGYIQSIEDIENAVVREYNNTAVTIGDIANVGLGPATRRGVLDKSGAEVVGGVVVARYGSNPLEVIQNVKKQIREIEPGLPSKILSSGELSQVKIIPFYDRTELIYETIGTLEEALSLEILITVIIVILMLFNLRASVLVSASLPVAVLMCFIAMKFFGVDANIVALSGIAIAIGTMVDMGIVLTESMVNQMESKPEGESLFTTIYKATTEVASAVITAVATTIISFLPVFTMEAAEGKLFRPLAFTKTFALIASIILAITVLPPLAHHLFSMRSRRAWISAGLNLFALAGGIILWLVTGSFVGTILFAVGLGGLLHILLSKRLSGPYKKYLKYVTNIVYATLIGWLLARVWMPLGVNRSVFTNFIFIFLTVGILVIFFWGIIRYYENILRFLLKFKFVFLLVIAFIVYQGFTIFRDTGEEFMPALDEGSFLLMPTSMPHSGMQENIKNLRLLDMSVTSIPEVEVVVGKAGRVQSALDPAPMSMYENVIIYKSEYRTDESGKKLRYKFKNGEYQRDKDGHLIPDRAGRYFRQWRDHIQSPDDIWQEIIKAADLPGVTSAPKLQPIQTRLVMLQTGMRAPMGIKVRGNDLGKIESFGIELEKHLKQVDGIKEPAVFAERIVGKPYLLLDIKREAAARYGLSIADIQRHIQAAIGGMKMTTTIEGRERYSVRVRYPRELRDDPESLKRIYVATLSGQQIPLGDLVSVRYEQGAQSIKSEDGFLVGYVLFDKIDGYSEVGVVENARQYLEEQIDNASLTIPEGISYRFAGNYEQQLRANKRLSIVLPLALAIIFLILYFQFRSVAVSTMVFTGVAIAFAGGFIMIGLYNTEWFMDFDLFGTNMRDLFQIRSINLSVAVWVGFLALFGIATDDGVLVATFLKSSFKKNDPGNIEEIREAVVEGGLRRVSPAMMTTATTLLALLPVLSSTGRGSDIMLPMAIPTFGGMTLQVITMFTVPVFYALWKESSLKIRTGSGLFRNSKPLSVLLVLFIAMGSISAQSIDSLTVEMFRNNPGLAALDAQYKAAMQRGPQVSQLPDPEIGIGLFPLPVETRLGAQLFRAGVTQMIPGKALRKAKADIEDTKAATLLYNLEATALELRYELEKAYLNLYEIRKSKAIIEQNISLLQSLENMALAKTETGRGGVSDVLRIRLMKDALVKKIEILNEQESMPEITINKLLNRESVDSVVVQDTFEFAELKINNSELIRELEAGHPLMKRYEIQKAISEKRLELNELEKKPVFGVGLDYIFVDGRNDAMPDGNGRDILQLRAMIKLPLNKEKFEARRKEEELKIASIEYMESETVNSFRATIRGAVSIHEIAKLEYELAEEQESSVNSIIRILENEYSTSNENFDALLELESRLIDYKVDKLKAVVKSHEAIIRIKKLIPDIID